MILGGVSSHPADRPVGGCIARIRALDRTAGVGPGADDEGGGAVEEQSRIGGTVRVAVGELHATVQAGIATFDQRRARLEERMDPGDADRHQAGREPGGTERGAEGRVEGGRGRSHPSIVADGGGSADATTVTQFGHQPGLRQHLQRPILADVDDDGIAGLA